MNLQTILLNYALLCCMTSVVFSQTNQDATNAEPGSPWKLLESGSDASLRGLHVVDDDIVWASGSGGTVLRSTDGGTHWTKTIVAGAEELDFRDIHAFDDKSAVIMSAGTPARIYRTEDGGKNWTMSFEHPHEAAFFDAISFWDQSEGIAMSDPIDDRVLLIKTHDGGKTWAELKPGNRPVVIPGEGGFAASGTNMILLENGDCLIALGSAKPDEQANTSRIVRSSDRGKSWTAVEVPIPRSQASGIFSMAFANLNIGVAVGGDYLQPESETGNIAVTSDGGKTWVSPSGHPPFGYRSGVASRVEKGSIVFIAVGTTGTDRSDDKGQSWKRVSKDAFHAIQFSPTGKTGFATGANGRIGRWQNDIK